VTPEDLAAWRAAHGLTLDELAAQLGLDRATIYRWEHGRRGIPGRLLALALWAVDHGALAELAAR
jgi:transcriptional regulator with XRE-family HTH domain